MSNVHIPYIKLTFGAKSFSWRSEEGRPDYFTSLSHKRYTEEANLLTVNLVYCPHPGENPNSLEDAIISSGGKCYVQYGDLGETTSQYKGLVHSYKVDFADGCLIYKISMISSLACYTYEQYPGCELSTKNGHTISDVENEVKKIVTQYMSTSGDSFKSYTYDSESGIDFTDKISFSSISVPAGNPITALRSIIRQLKVKKPLGDASDSIDTSYVSSEGSVSKFEDYSGVGRNLESHLTLDIDESGSGSNTVKIVMVNNNLGASTSYTFEWGSRDGEVLSWAPEYDGAYSIYKARGSSMFDTYISSDKDGKYGYTTFSYDIPKVLENGIAPDLFSQVENLEINQSEVDRHYEYKATLTVLGKSDKMDLGVSVIKVVPIVSGAYHHTAGDYVVIGVEDNVSSDGFTTTYTLYKRQSSSLYGNSSKGVQVYNRGSYVPIDQYDPSSGNYSSNPNPINPDPYIRSISDYMSNDDYVENGNIGDWGITGSYGSSGGLGGSSSGSTGLGGTSSSYSDSSIAIPYLNTKNYTEGRVNISRITIHHMAGSMTARECGEWFASPNCGSSSNYGVGVDGSVGQYVREKDRAWTSGSSHNDSRAITIEVSNDRGAGNRNGWYVNDRTMSSLINLCFDICKRNNITKLVYDTDDSRRTSANMKGNLTRHDWFASTLCPGEYLASKFPYIVEQVNKKLEVHTTQPGEAVCVSVESRALNQSEMNTNARFIYDYLNIRGWTLEAVSGMLGNMQALSTINPARWKSDAVGSSKSYGLLMWTYIDYNAWCDSNRYDRKSLTTALKRIEYELSRNLRYYPTAAYPESFSQFKTSKKPADYLACAFAWNYDKSWTAVYGSESEKRSLRILRGGYANQWYNYLKNLYS